MSLDKVDTKNSDPLKRQATVSEEDRGARMSPMHPPEGFDAAIPESENTSEMDPLLLSLMDDHKTLLKSIENYEVTIDSIIAERALSKESTLSTKEFLKVIDDEFIDHNKKEEEVLFPLLHEKMMENGEHSQSNEPITAVDILTNEHRQAEMMVLDLKEIVKFLETETDALKRENVLKHLIALSKELTGLLKLHIFREDSIVFVLAHEFISKEEFKKLK